MDLEGLLPQSGPMRLVEGPAEFSPEGAQVRVTIKPESAFFDGAQVPAYVALEYIAQAAAAHAGWQAAQRGEAPRQGVLAGCRKLQWEVSGFELGWQLAVEAEATGAADDARTYRGRVLRLPGGELLAQGQITVVLA